MRSEWARPGMRSQNVQHRPLGPPEALSIAIRDSHPLKALTTRLCRLLFVILFKADNGFVRRLFLRRAVRLECPVQVLLAAVVVQLLELDPARINEAVVILVLSKLAAGEVAQRRLRRGQLIAPLLPDEPLRVGEAHANHLLDLEAVCRHDGIVSSAIRDALLALRRRRLLAFVAGTHGAARILEHTVVGAVGARACGIGRHT
mmetsp:Transcript_13066/g.43487  ORF Transcript_13066/g.43487 Transcript_13066/m.43487 type:complete len:203 (+) Transcript_13066:282-890(+)